VSILAKYRELAPAQRKTLAAAWRALPRVAWRVRRGGVAPARAWLSRWIAPSEVTRQAAWLSEARSLARLVNAAARFSLFRVRCLEKSLLLEALLKARGIGCELKFGVHHDGRPFTAHAWVEVQGEAVGDRGGADPSLSALV
jgi:hypothetical protein